MIVQTSLRGGIWDIESDTGAARVFGAGEVVQTVVEMELGCMLLMAIADGSCLAVLASPRCDMGLVAYEMTLLVDRAGELVTPQLRRTRNCLWLA